MCSEADARTIIGADGAAVLLGIVEGAWSDYLKGGQPQSRSVRAAVVWDYMIQRADKDLVNLEGVRRVELHEDRPVYILRDRLVLRFKKHDRELTTRNYRTNAQRSLEETGAFDLLPGAVAISCGYVLDAAEAAIDRIVVVRRVSRRLEWSIPLQELASGMLHPITPILEGITESELASLPSIGKPLEVALNTTEER